MTLNFSIVGPGVLQPGVRGTLTTVIFSGGSSSIAGDVWVAPGRVIVPDAVPPQQALVGSWVSLIAKGNFQAIGALTDAVDYAPRVIPVNVPVNDQTVLTVGDNTGTALVVTQLIIETSR